MPIKTLKEWTGLFFPDLELDAITPEHTASAVWVMAHAQQPSKGKAATECPLTLYKFGGINHNYGDFMYMHFSNAHAPNTQSTCDIEIISKGVINTALPLRYNRKAQTESGILLPIFSFDGIKTQQAKFPTQEDITLAQTVYAISYGSIGQNIQTKKVYLNILDLIADVFDLANVDQITEAHIEAFTWYIASTYALRQDWPLDSGCLTKMVANQVISKESSSFKLYVRLSDIEIPVNLLTAGLGLNSQCTIQSLGAPPISMSLTDLYNAIDKARLKQTYNDHIKPKSLHAIVADILGIQEHEVTYDHIASCYYGTLYSKQIIAECKDLSEITAFEMESSRPGTNIVTFIYQDKDGSTVEVVNVKLRSQTHNKALVDAKFLVTTPYKEPYEVTLDSRDLEQEKCRQTIRMVHAARFSTYNFQPSKQQAASETQDKEVQASVSDGDVATAAPVIAGAHTTQSLKTSTNMANFTQRLTLLAKHMSPRTANMANVIANSTDKRSTIESVIQAIVLLVVQNPQSSLPQALELTCREAREAFKELPKSFFKLQGQGVIYIPPTDRSILERFSWLHTGGHTQDLSSIKRPVIEKEGGTLCLIVPCSLIEHIAPFIIALAYAIEKDNLKAAHTLTVAGKAAIQVMYRDNSDYVDFTQLNLALPDSPKEKKATPIEDLTLSAFIGRLISIKEKIDPTSCIFVDMLSINGQKSPKQYWQNTQEFLDYLLEQDRQYGGESRVQHTQIVISTKETMMERQTNVSMQTTHGKQAADSLEYLQPN